MGVDKHPRKGETGNAQRDAVSLFFQRVIDDGIENIFRISPNIKVSSRCHITDVKSWLEGGLLLESFILDIPLALR